jgi:hypothetical protein
MDDDVPPTLPPAEDEEGGERSMDVLGEGSFNCVLRAGKMAVRMHASVSAEADRMVMRADAMLQVFNETRNALGPCVLRLIERGQWLDPREVEHIYHLSALALGGASVCRDLRETSNNIYVQRVELAQLGDFESAIKRHRYAPDEVVAFAFCIVWFMSAAQTLFGFQHRDLKGGNLLMQELNRPARYRFRLGKEAVFTLPPLMQVPRVADLDFGSFQTTNDQNVRRYTGTFDYLPPEQTLENIYTSNEHSTPAGIGSLFTNPYCDWYSLGLTLLDMWHRQMTGTSLHVPAPPDEITARLTDAAFSNVRVALSASVRIVLKRSVVHYAFYGEVPKMSGAPIAAEYAASPRCAPLVSFVRNTLGDAQRQLLMRLLAWEPQRRTFNGHPHRLLTDMALFQPFLNAKGDADEEFAYEPRTVLELSPDPKDERVAFLRTHPRSNEF